MKLCISILLLILLSSCAGQRYIFRNMAGLYEAKGKDYTYELTLKQDSTFKYYGAGGDWPKDCHGIWKFIAKDSLRIQCKGTETGLPTSDGILLVYQSDLALPFAIVNTTELRLGTLLLKKRTDK